MTQTERVLDFMQRHGSITQKEAVDWIGCYRLSARIADLKRLGYSINSEYESTKNRYGDNCNFARYSLGARND